MQIAGPFHIGGPNCVAEGVYQVLMGFFPSPRVSDGVESAQTPLSFPTYSDEFIKDEWSSDLPAILTRGTITW